MRLGVNAVRLTRPFTGVGRYIECVLDEWSRMDHGCAEIVLYCPAPIDPDSVVFPVERFTTRVVGSEVPDPLWEWRWLRRAAEDVDVLFCPSYTVPFAYPGKCAVSYLGPSENRPLSFAWWRSRAYDRLYRYSARRADHVFACSQIVKRRVVEVYGVPANKIDVTFLASSSLFRPLDDGELLATIRRRLVGDDSPYVLFVGKLAHRHYIPNLVEAFAQARAARGFPHKLLIVGPDYLNLDVGAMARRHGVADAVVHHPFLPHAELPAVYNAAEAFVYPASEAEGFGIPPIEAMACGVPTLTTNQGSLREFAPGAALLVESPSTADLREGLERLLTDRSLRESLRERGLRRAGEITWRKTAEKTMAALWRVHGGRAC